MIKDKDESGSDPNQLTVIKEEPLTPENIKKETDSNDHKMNIEDECSTSNSKKTSVKQTNNFSSISANSNNKNNVPANKKESLMHDSLVSDNDLSNIIAIKTEDNSNLTQDSYSNISNNSSHITQTHVPLPNQQAPQQQPQLPQSQSQSQQQQQAPPQLTPENIQPLPSNIINRQTNNIEVQYMQQQSQIFVFSTLLANKGAEAVLQGHFQSIIAYHCAQPGTKKFLEKNPLKINQFNRPTSNTWINNIPVNRPKNCLRNNNNNSNLMPLNNTNNNHKRPSSLDGLIGADTLDDMVALSDSDLQWDQKNNTIGSLDNLGNGSLLSDIEQSTCMLQNSNVNSLTSSNQMLSNLQPSLQGVKVPDENLTPQQRQHREEQLATIRKMHQMLFPEHQTMNLDMTGLSDNQESNDLVPANISNMLDSCTDNASDKDALNSLLGGIMPSQRSSMNNMMPCSNPHQSLQPHPHPHSHSQSIHQSLQHTHPHQHHPPPPLPPPHPQSSIGQLEWKKLQNQFFDERKMKSPQNISKNSFPNTSNIRMQGPPPPYHQTTRSASVPIALQSPNPVSPINSTSNISLPSPRASSAVNSPSTDSTRTFPPSNKTLSQQHKSPNTNNNSQDSPTKLLNQSNPSTPISSHLSPNTGNSILEFTTGSMNSTTTTTSNSNGIYNHSLSQKQNTPLTMLGTKEANLMPVPSPQQISYLNTFDGQELTIQKQPNTSLKDGSISTPPMEESLQNTNKDCSIELETGSFSSITSVTDNCQFSTSSPQLPTVTTLSNSNINSTNNSSNNSNNVIQITSTTTTTPTNASNVHETHKTDLLSQSSNNLIDNSCYSLLVNDCNSFTSQQQQSQISGSGDHGPSSNQVQSQNQPQSQQQNPHQPNFAQHHTMNKNFIDIIPSNNNKTSNDNNFGCMRADNVPLNPNSSTNLLGNSKVSHFDPISSLAQMSQLLTNTPTSSMNNQQPNNTNMMMFNPQNSVHNMMNINDLSNCHNSLDFDNMMPPTHNSPNAPHQFNPNTANQMQIMNTLSPKIVGHLSYSTVTTGVTTTTITTTSTMSMITSSIPSSLTTMSQPNAPRMVGRPVPPNHPFNGTNVQVKPNAPNTIQYLPAKPQIENQNPRGPPSLDFLHRFTNPVSNMDSKMPGHNMPYFPPCNAGPNNMNHLNNMNHMDGSGPPPPPPQHMTSGHMMSPNDNMMMSGHPCRNNMINQPPMNMNMNMIRNAPPLRSGPGGGPVSTVAMGSNPMMRMPQMNFNQLNNLNQTDATQPLPPSMNQNNFKNSHFIGPTISDPNYAQQFHNFQQQLYATTTNRNPMNNSIMNPGPHNKF